MNNETVWPKVKKVTIQNTVLISFNENGIDVIADMDNTVMQKL